MTCKVTLEGGKGLIVVSPHLNDLVSTLNWVFENQPMVSGILTQSSSRNNLLADEKGHWKRWGGSYLYIHLYYRSVI